MTNTRFYEGMFLVDSSWANRSKDEVIETITGWIEKFNGKILRLEKWEERKLAYAIKIERTIHKRGVYYLGAIELPPKAVNEIYSEIKLNTNFLRAQFLQRSASEIDRIYLPFPTLEQWRRIITKNEDYFDQVRDLFKEKAKAEASHKAEVEADAQKIIEERKQGKIVASFDEEQDFEKMKKKEKEEKEEKAKKTKKDDEK